jgi:hypothetical protein
MFASAARAIESRLATAGPTDPRQRKDGFFADLSATLEAAGLALSLRSLARLAQVQEPGRTRSEARGRGGVGALSERTTGDSMSSPEDA